MNVTCDKELPICVTKGIKIVKSSKSNSESDDAEIQIETPKPTTFLDALRDLQSLKTYCSMILRYNTLFTSLS